MKPSALILTDQDALLESSRQALQESWDIQPARTLTEAREAIARTQYQVLLIDKQHAPPSGETADAPLGVTEPPIPHVYISNPKSKGKLEVHVTRNQVASPESDTPQIKESFGEQIDHELLRQTLFSQDGLTALLPKIVKTPSRPGVYFRVVEELTNPEGTIDNIASMVNEDPIATARILRAANSTALGLRRRLGDANEAVMMLGGERVKDVILLSEVLSVIDQNKCIGFSPDDVWTHSIQVGQLARKIMLAETRHQASRDAAFTAGLLHDVGKVLLAVNVPGRYAKTLLFAKRKRIPLTEAEWEEFQITHATLGCYLLESWDLPIRILEAIMWHHDADRYSAEPLTPGGAVFLANTLVRQGNQEEDTSSPNSPLTAIKDTWGEDRLKAWQELLDD